jgi:uridine kinase
MLGCKVILGTLLASFYARGLFIPFTNYFVSSGFHNPYAHFVALGRDNSFPYSPVMLYLLAAPRLLLSPLLPAGVDTVSLGHLFTLRLPLLAADLTIMFVLCSWFPNRVKQVLLLYWCSPIVAYICYWHGQLDIIPTALLFLTLHGVRQDRYAFAMACYGLALATKLHLIVALPFLVVYAAEQKGVAYLAKTLPILVGAALLGFGPFLFDPAFHKMVFATAEAKRLFAFQVPVGVGGLKLQVAPLALILLFFRFTAYPKRNWDLLILCLSIAFSAFVVLIPPRPAYILWSIPFTMVLLCRQERTDARFVLPFALTNAAYFLFFWLGPQSDVFDAWRVSFPAMADLQSNIARGYAMLGAHDGFESLTFTLLQGCLIGSIGVTYLFGVRSNAVYRMRTRPVLIGISGDSGSGKDTFTRLLMGLLTPDRAEVIAGDDYHRWPRGHEQWKVYSHLDVRGNNLHQQMEHAIALSSGNTVYKVHYDHNTGKFTEPQPVHPNRFLIFQGLHALAIQQLREMYDLRVFLDPDEFLRRLWKVQRDGKERGYTPAQVLESLQRRDADRHKYILSQRAHADLIVVWHPRTPFDPDAFDSEPKLALEIETLNSFYLGAFVDGVMARGIEVLNYDPYVDGHWQTLLLAGTISGAELSALAQEVIPNLDELSGMATGFVDGLEGCLQLITLLCMSYKLRFSTLSSPGGPPAAQGTGFIPFKLAA